MNTSTLQQTQNNAMFNIKKITLLTFIGLTSVFTAASQTFQWTTPQTVEENLAQNTTVQFPLHQQATGTGSITLGIEIIYNDIPASWDGMVCIYGSCLGVIPDVGVTAEMDPISGSIEGMVRLTVNPMSGTEVAKLQIYVYDINFPNDGDTATYLLNTTLGTDAVNALEKELTVAPNPANDIITIESSSSLKRAAMYSMSGKLISEIELNGLTTSMINVSGCTTGVYTLRIEDTNGNVVNRRVIKE